MYENKVLNALSEAENTEVFRDKRKKLTLNHKYVKITTDIKRAKMSDTAAAIVNGNHYETLHQGRINIYKPKVAVVLGTQ